MALYLDHSRVPYPGERSNTNTYWVVSQTLAAGGTLSLSAKNPAVASGVINSLAVAGTHTVYAQVDSYNNQVGETSEANNVWGPLSVDCHGRLLPNLSADGHQRATRPGALAGRRSGGAAGNREERNWSDFGRRGGSPI